MYREVIINKVLLQIIMNCKEDMMQPIKVEEEKIHKSATMDLLVKIYKVTINNADIFI